MKKRTGAPEKHPAFIIQSQRRTPHERLQSRFTPEELLDLLALPSGAHAAVKQYCSKRLFLRARRLSFQMDGGPRSPCGV